MTALTIIFVDQVKGQVKFRILGGAVEVLAAGAFYVYLGLGLQIII